MCNILKFQFSQNIKPAMTKHLKIQIHLRTKSSFRRTVIGRGWWQRKTSLASLLKSWKPAAIRWTMWRRHSGENQSSLFKVDLRPGWIHLAITGGGVTVRPKPIFVDLPLQLLVISYNCCKSHLRIFVLIHQSWGNFGNVCSCQSSTKHTQGKSPIRFQGKHTLSC